MNIDLIIKLARLANENPNENEANLAARKVCSLIKTGNYKFTNQSNIVNFNNPVSNSNDWFKDFYENIDFNFWDEILKNNK